MPKFGVSIYSVCRKFYSKEWTPMQGIRWLAEQGAEAIELVPFGWTDLRIAQFPIGELRQE